MCKFKEKKYQEPEITQKRIASKKDFWNFMKLLLTNKDFIDSTDMTLKLDNKIIAEEKNWFNRALV